MAPRRESRERALGLCYEGEVRELDPAGVLANLPTAPDDYAIRLLEGVDAHRAEIDAHGYRALISIDGGINAETAIAAGDAGVDILVAGSAVFRAPDPAAAAVAIRDAGAAARDARMADHG